MKRLTFVQIKEEKNNNCKEFTRLIKIYSAELDQHQNRTTPEETVIKWCDSILKKQDDKDRHLELCYDGNILIGFLYGKVDRKEHKGFVKPGYGYIMEFFVLPKHRRKGYGKEMFHHFEKLFIKDGVEKIYLTADPITGKPFWEALGFISTGELSPENNLNIYEKEIFPNLSFKIIKYPTETILCNIAEKQGDYSHRTVRGMTKIISSAHYNSDSFMVLVFTDPDNIIGCASFIQNSKNSFEWFYTDIWVAIQHRNKGIATKIVCEGLSYLTELDAKKLLCTVSPDNNLSLSLQKSLGFKEIPNKVFEDLETQNMIMFEKDIPDNYNTVHFSDDYNQTLFICNVLKHSSEEEPHILFKIIRAHLLLNDGKSEENYFIRKGIVIIAWIKFKLINNTFDTDVISIHPKYKNKSLDKYIQELINTKSLLLEEKVVPKVSDEV